MMCVFVVLASPSSAEIITGDIPGSNFSFPGAQHFIDDMGIGVVVDYGGGGGFSSLGMSIFPTGSNGSHGASFLTSGNAGYSNNADAYFVEGQAIGGDADEQGSIAFWYEENNCGCKDPTLYSLGFIGEYQYIGTKTELMNSAGNIEEHFGFIQLLRVSEDVWEPIGWAYETEADTELIAFNLIPAPSSLALLGAGGLCLTRRRRQ